MNVDRARIAAAVKAILLAVPGVAAAQAQPATSAQLEEVQVYGKAEQYRPEDQTSATGLKLPLIETPQSISVISDEMLKLFNVRSAYDAADIIPGVSAGGQAFGAERLFIRGQLLTEPRVNGVNVPTGQYLDSYAVERLEVVRGPATVLYGVTGSFGGEVNQILSGRRRTFTPTSATRTVTSPAVGMRRMLQVQFRTPTIVSKCAVSLRIRVPAYPRIQSCP